MRRSSCRSTWNAKLPRISWWTSSRKFRTNRAIAKTVAPFCSLTVTKDTKRTFGNTNRATSLVETRDSDADDDVDGRLCSLSRCRSFSLSLLFPPLPRPLATHTPSSTPPRPLPTFSNTTEGNAFLTFSLSRRPEMSPVRAQEALFVRLKGDGRVTVD